MRTVGTINPERDYPEISRAVEVVRNRVTTLTDKGCRIEIPHTHRYWEYGTALQLALDLWGRSNWASKEALNVGGGWDPLSPSLALGGAQVVEIEPDATCRANRSTVNSYLESVSRLPIKVVDSTIVELSVDKQYDAVYCISVLEHVYDEFNAWKKLAQLVKPGGFLFITCDCVPEKGRAYTFDNLRVTNYTLDDLSDRVAMMNAEMHMTPIGVQDYVYHGDHVFDYTFFRAGFTKRDTGATK